MKIGLHTFSDISLSSSSNGGTRCGDQEVACWDPTIRSSCALQLGRIDTREGAVGPGARLPRVSSRLDGRDQGGLSGALVYSRDVVLERGG
jgi:hypothetical protein